MTEVPIPRVTIPRKIVIQFFGNVDVFNRVLHQKALRAAQTIHTYTGPLAKIELQNSPTVSLSIQQVGNNKKYVLECYDADHRRAKTAVREAHKLVRTSICIAAVS